MNNISKRYSKLVDGKPELFERCDCGGEILFHGSWKDVSKIDTNDCSESAYGHCDCGVSIHCDGIYGKELRETLEHPIGEE